MQRGAMRLATWAGLSAISIGLLGVYGCSKLESEASQSERHVDEVAQEAVSKEEAQQPALYGQAAEDVTGKSDVAVARARELQARAEYSAGTKMMRQASNQASDLAMRMIEINHLISTIQTSNALVAGYSKYDASPIRAEAKSQVAQIQGSANQSAWVDTKHPVPSLSAVKQTISKLQGQISRKQEQVEKLSQQRVEDLRKAEDLAEQADKATGQAWVDLFKQASELRRQAANISTRIDVINTTQIAPLKVDLTIAQAQQKIAEVAIADVNKQATGAVQHFEGVRQAVGTQDKVVKNVYENTTNKNEGANASLKGQLDALMDQAKQVQVSWDAAAKLLSDSADHFAAANSAAESLQLKLERQAAEIVGDAPVKAAWDQLNRVYNPTTFRYYQAVSLQTLGTLYAEQLSSVKQLADLKARALATLKEAKLNVPDSLSSADFDSRVSQVSDNGEKAFSKADDLFQNVINAPVADAQQKNAGRAARVLELFAWSQLDDLSGNGQSATHLSAARDAIKDAADNNAVLPVLPLAIEPHITAPDKLTTSQPAAQGTANAADAATVAAIKQSLNDALAALQAGDAAKLKQFIITPPEDADAMNTFVSLMANAMHLQKAVTTKFGDQAKQAFGNGMQMDMPSAQQIDAMLAKAQFRTTGPDTVAMTVPGSPQAVPLKKNGAVWAIDLTSALKEQPQAAVMLPAIAMMVKPIATSFDKIASDVDAGKYANVGQVKADLDKAIAPLKGMMPGAGANPNVAGGAKNPPAAH